MSTNAAVYQKIMKTSNLISKVVNFWFLTVSYYIKYFLSPVVTLYLTTYRCNFFHVI